MKDLRNKVVALTGAGSGIGRALAVRLADEGCRLAISDVNECGLEETRALATNRMTVVRSYHVDVADRAAVRAWARAVEADFGGADVIINNAGVVVSDTLADVSYEDFEWLMSIDFWGVVYGTKEFLPLLHRRPEGHIVNISSINGMLPFPFNGPYNCAKFAVRAFNETLMMELRDTNIHVTSVHPGGVKTNIVNSCRFVRNTGPDHATFQAAFNQVSRMTAETAADKIVRGIRKDKERLLVGADAWALDFFARLNPRFTHKVTAAVFEWVTKKHSPF
mgnify:CR=1 FL=1